MKIASRVASYLCLARSHSLGLPLVFIVNLCKLGLPTSLGFIGVAAGSLVPFIFTQDVHCPFPGQLDTLPL